MFDFAYSDGHHHQHPILNEPDPRRDVAVAERTDDRQRIQARHIARRFHLQPQTASLVATLCFSTTAVR